MVNASRAAPPGGGAISAGPADFAITLKGWRSQLRWAMTQREEDPARVWLEVISIDERSKQALKGATTVEHLGELNKFRAKLEASIASLTEELGDDKVAPLYAWLDLIRQKRRLAAKVEEARNAVTQARALKLSEDTKAPTTEEDAAEQLALAQGELAQWKAATPPQPPPEVLALWEVGGGEALVERMPREAMAVGRRGDEARRVLAAANGRSPGKHPWRGSKGELILVPVAGGLTLLIGLFAASMGSGTMGALAGLAAGTLVALIAYSLSARQLEKAELDAAVAWVWHARMYAERTTFAELEAGWLRALRDASRALKSFESNAATGGQLRDFEAERPDLTPMVHEVAQDTEPSQ